MIERLVIHRFRGIREGVLEDIGKVNLLIGPNNAGKTAILEMMYLAGLCGRPCSLLMREVEPSAWPATTLIRYDFLGEELMPRLRVRHGEPKVWQESPAVLTEEHSLAVSLNEMTKGHPMREFELSAPLDEPGRKRGFFQKDISRTTLFRIGQQKGQLEAEIPGPMLPPLFAEKDVRLEETFWTYLWEPSLVYRWEAKEDIDHLAVWAIKGQLPTAEHVLFFDFHAANQHFNPRFTQAAKNTIADWYEKIAQSLARVFPSFDGIRVEIDDAPGNQKGESGYVSFTGKTRLAIDHFGDGARHAFKVLASLIALTEKVDENRPGLFLWEDPELFMHPASLQRLLTEVMDLVAEKPIQVVLSSQSLEVIAWLGRYLDRSSVIIKPGQIRTFRLNLQTGALHVQPFKGKAIARWIEFFGDPRMVGEDELSSPLAWLFHPETEEVEE